MDKFNFVFYSTHFDFYDPIFPRNSVNINIETRKFGLQTNNKFVQLLFNLHWSQKVNRIINLPFRRIWYKQMCRTYFSNSNPVVRVFLSGQYTHQDDGALISYIKCHYPDDKIVNLHLDIIKTDALKTPDPRVDLHLSYDRNECEKYGFTFWDGPYYTARQKNTEPSKFDYDVYFLGYAKNRLTEIIEVFDALTAKNLKCLFMIAGVPKCDRKPRAGLVYLDKPIPYSQNIENIQRSKCILELMQGNTSAATLRACEAVAYKRKLITNCRLNETAEELFCAENMLIFSNPDEIAADFIASPIDYSAFESCKLSPAETLPDRIEKLLISKDTVK